MKKKHRYVSVTISLGVYCTLADEESDIPEDVLARIKEVLKYVPQGAKDTFDCSPNPRVKSLRVKGFGLRKFKHL